MERDEKIGIGIVTYNRPDGLKKLLDSISYCNFADVVIVNDGDRIDNLPGWNYHLINNETNLGVGKSKNIALRALMEKECDHFFLIEDDIFVKDEAVFQKYIDASKASGIQHFNFSQHGIMNKSYSLNEPDLKPHPRLTVDYKSSKISLYPHCVGAFSYYSKKCLDKVGLLDERYFNACEHVDHTFEIIKADMHPPFWWFADIYESWKYLGDEEWSIMQSTISSNPNHNDIISKADQVFIKKHGILAFQIKDVSENEVGKKLKFIKSCYTKPIN